MSCSLGDSVSHVPSKRLAPLKQNTSRLNHHFRLYVNVTLPSFVYVVVALQSWYSCRLLELSFFVVVMTIVPCLSQDACWKLSWRRVILLLPHVCSTFRVSGMCVMLGSAGIDNM